MTLNGTTILELLQQKPGRYIQHDMGLYPMKKADEADVLHTDKNGREYPIELLTAHMDGLMDEGRLVRDGSSYLLPSPSGTSCALPNKPPGGTHAALQRASGDRN